MNTKTSLLLVFFAILVFGIFIFPDAILASQYNLQSITIYESSSSAGGPEAYYFNSGDTRFTSKISSFGENGSNDMPGTVEKYDVYFSDSNGNLDPNGSYVTIDSYRDNDTQNVAVGGNISAVKLNFSDGTIIYASSVARVVNGTGLSGAFASTKGYATNALGAPIPSGQGLQQPAPGFKTTYLGDHFSSITLGFQAPVNNITCSTSSDCGTSGYVDGLFCQGNNVYRNYKTYTCNNAGSTNSYCENSINSQLYQTCSNNQTCSNGSCTNQNYNPYPQPYPYPNNCTYHAYKLCIGNSVYWYDSCGTQQDLFQTCYGTNQTCQYGQCVYQQPTPTPTPNPYVQYYQTRCSGDNLYWYDSLGQKNSLYKTCADTNSCTVDVCASGKCSNTLKCDGSTCVGGTADYQTYCASSQPTIDPLTSVSVSFFAKQDTSSMQWLKSVQVGESGQLYFMVSLVNSGTTKVDNVIVFANIPMEIATLGNLEIDGVAIAGDIVSGVNIGSLAPTSGKTITFEGHTQAFSTQGAKQAVITINALGSNKTDTLSITFNPGQVAGAAVSESTGSVFWDFLKRWYLWILVALVLIFLFVVVFRRLSSNA